MYIKRVVEFYNNWIILISMKYELVEWLGIELVCAWLWVQTLEGPNETLFFWLFWSCLEFEGLKEP